MASYLADQDELAQRLLQARADDGRRAREDRIRELVQTLGDIVGERTSVKPQRDEMMRELELLEIGSLAVNAAAS
jgi:hypothetical protein